MRLAAVNNNKQQMVAIMKNNKVRRKECKSSYKLIQAKQE